MGSGNRSAAARRGDEEPRSAGERVAAEEVTDQIWEHHVFVCTGGDWCLTLDGDGKGVHARFKQLVAEAGLKRRVRVNHAGCLDQCGHGPMVVIYPETVWYWGVQPADVEEIVREHLLGGRPVERLRYRNTPGKHKLLRDERGKPIGRLERGASKASPASEQRSVER
jgi:(2Fe-2S) ferredoxin